MAAQVQFTLSFTGADAERSVIDFYDISQALIGFERSLALTTHLVLNDEIITQAPALKGARIYALVPELGSWKFTAVVVASTLTGAFHVATLENKSPLGHLVFSMYDYVISQSLGQHVDYGKSLGKAYEEAKRNNVKVPQIRESQADSLIEKCSTAIREMHRPIYKSETATAGSISSNFAGTARPLSTTLTLETYDFIHETRVADAQEAVVGRVSSYNSNTFKGRIYVAKFGRPVPFELAPNSRTQKTIRFITTWSCPRTSGHGLFAI